MAMGSGEEKIEGNREKEMENVLGVFTESLRVLSIIHVCLCVCVFFFWKSGYGISSSNIKRIFRI